MTTNRLTIDLDLSQLFYGSEIHGDDEIPTPLLTGIVKEIAQHYMREIGMDLKREAENALKQAIYMSEAMKQAKAEVIGAVKAKGAGVSITIYNRSGSPLYTAETATTIREAVDAAVARGADLRGADLRGAVLSNADLLGAPFRIEKIHQSVYKAASADGALDMNNWYACETTHCRAGWIVTLAGDAGRTLEWSHGTAIAAALIYMASDPNLERIPDFYCDNETALEDMRRLAEAEAAMSD